MVQSCHKELKTLWEKEKLFVMSNFSFSLSVFKALALRHLKTWVCLGKDERLI